MFLRQNYLDFHTHRLRYEHRNDITEIISLELGDNRAHHLYTISKHPWVTKKILSTDEQRNIREHLENENCLALGEIGLDKLKGVPLEQQLVIFQQLLSLASEQNTPVIIHCVKAFALLIETKKEFPQLTNWCVHGFSRHWTLANQLLQQGFYLSIMPKRVIDDTYIELISNLPADKFFLETDSMPDSNIEEIYLHVSEIRQTSVVELKQQMAQNATTFFRL